MLEARDQHEVNYSQLKNRTWRINVWENPKLIKRKAQNLLI